MCFFHVDGVLLGARHFPRVVGNSGATSWGLASELKDLPQQRGVHALPSVVGRIYHHAEGVVPDIGRKLVVEQLLGVEVEGIGARVFVGGLFGVIGLAIIVCYFCSKAKRKQRGAASMPPSVTIDSSADRRKVIAWVRVIGEGEGGGRG